MPSPFPGMDPFLEDPVLWPDVHHGLISSYQALLNRHIRSKYVARVEQRVYLSGDDNPETNLYVPDVRVDVADGQGRRRGGRKAAVRAADEPIELTLVTPDEVSEAFIEVRTAADGAVVAVIEVLSPSNKIYGSAGRDSFLKKKREVVTSDAHWVEIDLLRFGAKPTFAKFLPPHEYLVQVIPVDRRPKGFVWPARLVDRLPTVTIPLRGGDPPAPLDLQAALDMAYERAAYDASVDYADDPMPPLPDDLAKWADELLREKKLR